MYLREYFIQFLKIKNIIFLVVGIFLVSMSVAIMTALTVYYFGDWNTIVNAKAMPESIRFIYIGTILIILSRISRKLINDAGFYSSCFEVSLSGYVTYDELSEVSGKPITLVWINLLIVRPLYMKKFSLRNVNGNRFIELHSKTCECECHSCGAHIEKRVYFEGSCPYCGSSDLFAKVISDNKFYSISTQQRSGINNPIFYAGKNLNAKMIGISIALIIVIALEFIFVCFCIDSLSKINDRAYLTKVLLSGKSYSSFELIQKEMMNTIIFAAFSATALGCAIPLLGSRLASALRAKRYAAYFSRFPSPFLYPQDLAKLERGNFKRALKGVVKALRERYLRNCSPEKQSGELKVSLAKQVIKDSCPYCGAPIVGAVSENHTCYYCRRVIMGVIDKQN